MFRKIKVPPPREVESASIYDLQNCKAPFKHKIKTTYIRIKEKCTDRHLIEEKKATDQQSNRDIQVSMNMELLQFHIASWVHQVFVLEYLINLFYFRNKISVVRKYKKEKSKHQKVGNVTMSRFLPGFWTFSDKIM